MTRWITTRADYEAAIAGPAGRSPDSLKAFRLLVAVIEQDGAAMEIGMDYEFDIETALERAAALIANASPALRAAQIRETLTRWVADDGYGTRATLEAQLESLDPSP